MKRTTTKLYGVLLTVLAALVLTGSASVTTQAKTKKPYKTKTIKVVEGKSKTYAQGNKIKKVKKVSKNKAFSVKVLSGKYRIKVSGTDRGKKQTIKIYFKNGKTQKVNLKTKVNYLNKIKAELKPMLADPDKGLRTAISQWEAKLEKKNNSVKYIFSLYRDYDGIKKIENAVTTPDSFTIDEVIAKCTPSQKKALILQVYLRSRMTYSYKNKGDYFYHRKSNSQYAKLYNGTFKGVCADGAHMATDIANATGFTAKCVGSPEMNHAWCIVKTTDTNNNDYWQGIFATSDAYNLKNSLNINKDNYTESYLSKHLYSPARSMIVSIKRPRNYVDLNPTTPTAPSAVTASAIKCPGCTGKLSHSTRNPYLSKCDGAVMSIIPMGSTTEYHPHNGGGVIRFFDDYGNEWLDVPADVKQRYEALYL